MANERRSHRKIVQAKHIPDMTILQAIEELTTDGWTNTTAVAEKLPAIPYKVVQAKLRRLLERGMVTGCGCGCRGDWELTNIGKAFAHPLTADDIPAGF